MGNFAPRNTLPFTMIIFFLLLPLLYLAGNIYIYCKLWRATKRLNTITRTILTLLFWATAASLFLSIGLRDNEELPQALSRIMFRGGSLWIVFIIFTALISLVLDTARRLFPTFRCNLAHATAISVALLCYGHYNYRNPQIVPLGIEIDKPMEGSMKIAVVSDLHLGHGTGKGMLQRIVELINKQKPDLILIAGDLIDNSIKPVIAAQLHEELQQLHAPMGIYMAPGNHEYISGYEECLQFTGKTPIKMLRDTIVALPNGVQLLLRDDAANRGRMSIEEFYSKADSTRPTILVDHIPYNLAGKNSLGIDLQLSGHTHHGQVWPGNYITDYLYEQSYGYRKWSHSHIWVSSGVSLWGPPVRLGTKGDIAIITLKGQDKQEARGAE